MKKLIVVTKTDIRKGIQSSVHNDPIALAVSRALKASKVVVGVEDLAVGDFPTADTYALPRSVQRFIRRFDTKGKKAVTPFRFYLDSEKPIKFYTR